MIIHIARSICFVRARQRVTTENSVSHRYLFTDDIPRFDSEFFIVQENLLSRFRSARRSISLQSASN